MEERKSYQLYLLEGEEQRAEFEYLNAYQANEGVQNRINDIRFYLRMSIFYAGVMVFFAVVAAIIGAISQDGYFADVIIVFIFLAGLISLILWLGIIWKSIKYGFSYKKLKKRKEQAEAELLCASQKLNSIQIKAESLREEIALEEEQRNKEEPALILAETREALILKVKALENKIEKVKKNYDETETEFHVLLKEEYENERDKKRYGRLTIIGVIILMILAVIQTLDVSIFSTVASKVIILLMPWCIIMPYSIGWLSKAMNTFWGEKLWINRFVFKEIHNYSIAERIRKSQENMDKLKEDLAAFEKEKEALLAQYNNMESNCLES